MKLLGVLMCAMMAGNAAEKTVKMGEQASWTINGQTLSITLSDLVADSRCPEGARCFTAGEAVVAVTIKSATTEETVELSTSEQYSKPVSAKAAGCIVALKKVDPHPINNQPPPEKEAYQATFQVTSE